MKDEWSTEPARRVRVCPVLAMHLPNLDIHTSWRFPCASIHPFRFLHKSKRKVLARACLAVALI